MSTITIKIKKLSHGQDLPLPSYATLGSSGVDLLAATKDDIILKPFNRSIIPTAITMEIPDNYEGQIRSRSGITAKHGVKVLNSPGTIDSDYRGEIKVILINLGEKEFIILRGMKIAQLVISPYYKILWQEDALTSTERSEGGFGSTGV